MSRKLVYFHQKIPPRTKPVTYDVDARLSTMSVLELSEGINNLLRALRKKGIEVRDYDHGERILYKVQQVKGGLYFLASEPEE